MSRFEENLRRTAALIDAAFTLKYAWLQSRHPDLGDGELRRRIYEGIVERKERQWKSQAEF